MGNRSKQMQQAWKDGKFANRKDGPKWNRWTPPMDNWLRANEGKLNAARMADEITEEFGVPRTSNGVLHRLSILGLSPYPQDYTLQQVARYLGVNACTVHGWIKRGYIVGEKLSPNSKGGVWAIKPEILEEFIRSHPEMYQPERMPKSQWKSLAEIVWSRDPLYLLKDVATMLDICPSTLGDYLRRGWAQGTPRVDRNGRTVKWFIKRSQLSRFFAMAYSSSLEAGSFPTPTFELDLLSAPNVEAACF